MIERITENILLKISPTCRENEREGRLSTTLIALEEARQTVLLFDLLGGQGKDPQIKTSPEYGGGGQPVAENAQS